MRRSFFVWSAVLIVSLSTGCKGGPSDADISDAVTTTKVPSAALKETWFQQGGAKDGDTDCGIEHGPIKRVTKVEVVQRGEKNEKAGYFPVKVKIAGICMAVYPTCGPTENDACPPKEKEFGIAVSLKLRKDDYGKWLVEWPTYAAAAHRLFDIR